MAHLAALRDFGTRVALAKPGPRNAADGSECLFDVYIGKVLWDGKERRILVDEADTDPLVGMALLRGYEVNLQVRYRGKVTIKRLRERGRG